MSRSGKMRVRKSEDRRVVIIDIRRNIYKRRGYIFRRYCAAVRPCRAKVAPRRTERSRREMCVPFSACRSED